MALVGDSAHTSYGPGTITEIETVRGRTSLRVAGKGFNVWLDQTKVHAAKEPSVHDFIDEEPPHRYHDTGVDDHAVVEHPRSVEDFLDPRFAGLESTIEPGTPYHVMDNSTVLPYNPDPQHHVDLFRHEQNIQPGEFEIDRDDRLHSSDSMSLKNKGDNRPYPGPNPDLFAKSSARDLPDGPPWQPDWDEHAAAEYHANPHMPPEAMNNIGRYHELNRGDQGGYNFSPDQWHDLVNHEEHHGWMSPEDAQSSRHDIDRHFSSHYYYADQAGIDPGDPTIQDPALSDFGPPSVTNSTAGEAGINRMAARYGEFEDDPSRPEWGEDDWHEGLPDGPERTLNKSADWRFANEAAGEDVLSGMGGEAHSLNRPRGTFQPVSPVSPNTNAMGVPQLPVPGFEGDFSSKPATAPLGTTGSTYRPAGLSDRYAYFDVEAETHPGNDVARFRQDPLNFIAARGHAMSDWDDQLSYKFADYTHLLSADHSLRTAAHDELSTKASLLCIEGRVRLADRGPHRVYAQVQGDHGTYDVLLARTGSRIAAWHCGCEWGRWAFANRMTDPRQLCSHARAARRYLPHYGGVVDDFTSWLKENDRTADDGAISDFIHISDNTLDDSQVETLYKYVDGHDDPPPERKYDVGYENDPEKVYKDAAADDKPTALRLRPEGLAPNLHQVEGGDGQEWVDVTKDERETTGPDDIVHFSSNKFLAFLHYAEDDGILDGEIDQAGAGGNVTARLHRADGPPDPASVSEYDLKQHPEWRKQVEPGVKPTGGSQQPSSPDQTQWQMTHPGQQDPGMQTGEGPRGPANPLGDAFNSYKNYSQQGGGQQPTPATTVSDVKPGNPSQLDMNQVGVKPGQPVPSVQDVKSQFQVPGQGAAPAPPKAPAGATPSNPTWFPTQESTTTNNDPSSPWTQNQNKTPLGGNSYSVQRGDTLSDIADRAGIGRDNYQQLADANGIKDPNKIDVGQQIKLPGSGAGTTQPNMPAAPAAEQPGAGEAPVPGYNPAGGRGPMDSSGKMIPPSTTTPAGSPTSGAGQADNPANPLRAMQLPNAGGAPGGGAGGATPSIPKPPTVQAPSPPKPPVVPGLPGQQKGSRRYYGEDTRPDTAEAAGMLDELRGLSQQDPHYHDMADHNDKVSDLVEALQDAGVDASYFVASLHNAAPIPQRADDDPSDGDANFQGLSNPNWADEPFQGSGPDPKLFMGDSASYVDEHERPDFVDIADGDGDIIKFNDSRSKPQQGPRQSAVAALHYAFDATQEDGGYFNPNNPDSGDWEAASGQGFVNELKKTYNQFGGGGLLGGGAPGGGKGGGGAAGEAGEAAEGGEAAEVAPELLAVANIRRAGGGPRQQVRIDQGARGWAEQRRQAAPMPPEDFGNNGEPTLADYSGSSELGGGGDILANFHRSGAAGEIMSSRSATGNDDIASAAQAFLRTAGRKYSPDEQRMLEGEFHPQGARNLPTDDELAGTHYLLGL